MSSYNEQTQENKQNDLEKVGSVELENRSDGDNTVEAAIRQQMPGGNRVTSKSTAIHSIEDGDYEIFCPRDLSNDKVLPKLIMKTARNKTLGRVPRVALFLIIPCIFFPVLFFSENTEFTVARMYAVTIFILFLFYYIHLYCVIFVFTVDIDEDTNKSKSKSNSKSKSKSNESSYFRVYSVNSVIPYWSPMPVSYRALLFRHYPMESFSEIAAIQGSIAQNTTQGLTMLVFLLFIHILALELWSNQIVFGFGIVAALLGSFGIFLSGQFELDPFNRHMIFLHRVGEWLKMLLIEAYLEQQILITMNNSNYWYLRIIPPILLFIIAVTAAGLRRLKFVPESRKFASENKTNVDNIDKAKLNELAHRNVVSEMIYGATCILALVLWLVNNEWCYDISYNGCYGN